MDADAQISYSNIDDSRLELKYCCIDTPSFAALPGIFDDTPVALHNIKDDPNFINAAGGNLRLLKVISPGSPFTSFCINAGNNDYLPCIDVGDLDKDGANNEVLPKDLDLSQRIACITVDMGAYECPIDCEDAGQGGGMRPGGEGGGENPDVDPAWDCYFDDGSDEELAERCAS